MKNLVFLNHLILFLTIETKSQNVLFDIKNINSFEIFFGLVNSSIVNSSRCKEVIAVF